MIASNEKPAQISPAGDANHGDAVFGSNCALLSMGWFLILVHTPIHRFLDCASRAPRAFNDRSSPA